MVFVKKALCTKLILFSLLVIHLDVKATHLLGTEISYRHVSDSTYEFTLKVYLNDCICALPVYQHYIYASSNSLSVNQTQITLYRVPWNYNCGPYPDNIFNCSQSTLFCPREDVFRGTFTLPGKADDWVFNLAWCCRYFNSLSGIENLSYGYQWMEVGLNNLDFPDMTAKNISPLWHDNYPNIPGFSDDTLVNYPIKAICAGKDNVIDQGAKEYQGDSLVYSFYHPQGINGDTIPYQSPYSFSNPMATMNGPLTINPHTGVINIVPGNTGGSGLFSIGIQATEYRNDTVLTNGMYKIVPKQIGYVRREMLIIVNDTNNCRQDSIHPQAIVLDSLPIDNKIAVRFKSNDTTVYNNFSLGAYSRVRCNTISSDGTEFRVLDSSGYVAPFDTTVRNIAVLGIEYDCNGGYTDEIILELAEPLTCGDYHLILKTGTDLDVLQSECGFWEPEFSSAPIITIDSVPDLDLGPDTSVCKWTQFTIEFDAGEGYSSYFWDTWDTTQVIEVSFARDYVVEVEDRFGCKQKDTISIKEYLCGQSNYTGNAPSQTFDPIMTTSISEVDPENLSLSVFPNPASSFVNIQFEGREGQARMILFDSKGNKILEKPLGNEVNGLKLDVSAMSEGVYFFKIEDRNGVVASERFLVRRN